MEREYRLDLDRYEFYRAIETLSGSVSATVASGLRLTFENGRLTLRRMFGEDAKYDVSETIAAAGWWPFPVDAYWRHVVRFHLGREYLLSDAAFSLRLASGLLHVRDQPVGGAEILRGQMAMDFTAVPESHAAVPEEAHVIAPTTPLDALLARIALIDARNAGQPPAKVSEIAERYERDGELVQLLKWARGHRCQICGSGFRMRNGGTYTEAHHLEQLANGGLDVSRNMLVLCANHHRQFHFGYVDILHHDADTLTLRLDDEVHAVSLAFLPPAEQTTPNIF